MKLALRTDGKAYCLLCNWEQPDASLANEDEVLEHLKYYHGRLLIQKETQGMTNWRSNHQQAEQEQKVYFLGPRGGGSLYGR